MTPNEVLDPRAAHGPSIYLTLNDYRDLMDAIDDSEDPSAWQSVLFNREYKGKPIVVGTEPADTEHDDD